MSEATPTQGESGRRRKARWRPSGSDAGRATPSRARSRRSRSLTLMQLADTGPVRLGSLADASARPTRPRRGPWTRSSRLAERRPDPGDARGVLVAATREGAAEVRARRRRLASARGPRAGRPLGRRGATRRERARRAPSAARQALADLPGVRAVEQGRQVTLASPLDRCAHLLVDEVLRRPGASPSGRRRAAPRPPSPR